LIELLVVITILAILVGLALPVIFSARINALAMQSTSNLRQLAAANFAFAADQGYYVPAQSFPENNKRWCGGRSNGSEPWDPTEGYLADYLGESRSVTACPLFTKMVGGNASFSKGAGGYGYNSAYIGGLPGSWQTQADGARVSARTATLERASTTVMFATSALARAGGVQEYPFIEPPFWPSGPNSVSGMRPTPSVHFRFKGKALVAWADGRVTSEEREERQPGTNPYGGNATENNLGWFGPDEENGYWNPRRSYSHQP